MEKENNESKKVHIGRYKKIEDILDNDRIIKIYGLLPNRESKKAFLERLLEVYEDRLSEKFEERLEDEFEPSYTEVRKQQLKDNIRSMRSLQGVLRGRKLDSVNQEVTERINYLNTQLQQGNYISKEDIEFLASHLADRPSGSGFSPTSRRDEIRSIIDSYIKARNEENQNRAQSYLDKQLISRDIIRLKHQLKDKILHQYDPVTQMEAGATRYGENNQEDSYTRVTNRRQREIQDIKDQIVQLEELQNIGGENNQLNSMLHMPDSEVEGKRSISELEKLMAILEEENKKISEEGIKLPKIGIKEHDEINVPVEGNTGAIAEKSTINPNNALENALRDNVTATDVSKAINQQVKDERNEGDQVHEQ